MLEDVLRYLPRRGSSYTYHQCCGILQVLQVEQAVHLVVQLGCQAQAVPSYCVERHRASKYFLTSLKLIGVYLIRSTDTFRYLLSGTTRL